MGNAASEPISAAECKKYGISADEIHEYNAVVEKVKKKSKSNKEGKIEKKDLDEIHKYCIRKDKQRRRGSVTSKTSRTSKSSNGSGSNRGLSTAQLQKLLEKQLALEDPSIMINSTDDGHTSASSQNSSSRFKAVGPPLMIDMSSRSNHHDDVSVMCDPTVAPTPKTVDC